MKKIIEINHVIFITFLKYVYKYLYYKSKITGLNIDFKSGSYFKIFFSLN